MIIVIGGGPAGRMSALRLAAAGKEVTILEKRALGGQCVHDGCMLVCGLNDAARALRNARFLKERGIVSGEISIRYPELIDKLEDVQSKLAHILERETKDAGVKIEYGVTAEVRDGKVFVNDELREAESVVIAAGGEMNVPDIEGANLCGTYTARTIKTMRELPKRMVIVGGGISAAEFAYIYSAFGVEVTLLARSKLLSVLPESFMKAVHRDLADVEIFEDVELEKIIGADKVKGVVFNGNTIACDAVLFATGIKPVSPYVTGIDKNSDGSIKVDENMETSIKGVYAAGDILGAPYFTPVSRLQGFAAADAILGSPRKVDLSQVPFCVVLGLDYMVCPAIESGVTYSSYNIAGPDSFWHVADGSVGSMHLTVDKDSGKILGFASSGPSTSIVGTYLGYLVRKGVTVHEFSPMLEVHPMSDGLYSLIRFADE
ncbi:MAG: NAD(P)/FAD-dependent oxidoreductase [Methanocorpusculum sp.]|nr:NAD(P)/FAD-dependent oxidoreductase [Methanocorpusculum sp.]